MSLTVLIVDDSRFARTTLRNMIGRRFPSYSIIEAVNGQDAIEKFRQTRADIVLMDYNMPGDDGLSAAASILDEFPGTRITLVTANLQPSVAAKARELGVLFFPKPVDENNILAMLQQE